MDTKLSMLGLYLSGLSEAAAAVTERGDYECVSTVVSTGITSQSCRHHLDELVYLVAQLLIKWSYPLQHLYEREGEGVVWR